jgi:hypothetical protein
LEELGGPASRAREEHVRQREEGEEVHRDAFVVVSRRGLLATWVLYVDIPIW